MTEHPEWLGPALEHYEIRHRDTDMEQRIRCPLGTHDDKRPSASVNLGKGLWQCMACNLGGDAIALIMERENVNYVEAVQFAGRIVEGNPGKVRAVDDAGGGILAHRKRHHQGGGGWRFTWGSAE